MVVFRLGFRILGGVERWDKEGVGRVGALLGVCVCLGGAELS